MKTIAGMLIAAGLFAATGAQAQQTYTYTYTGQTLQNGTWGPTMDGGVPPAGNQVPRTLGGSITSSWDIQVTANGGDSWYWVTLSSLNLGSN